MSLIILERYNSIRGIAPCTYLVEVKKMKYSITDDFIRTVQWLLEGFEKSKLSEDRLKELMNEYLEEYMDNYKRE
jgi:hypothetical protein